MIVKKVAKMSKGGGSFGGLANYLMDVKNNGEKVQEFNFTNCNFGDDFNLNLKEVTNTQKVNTTTINDKTYHLIVSFQEDENPSLETIKSIESELAKSLGFENHQRLSVIHNNTNNLHIHIAINRIDPETFMSKDPFRDIHTLQNKATELEEKYQLKRDNHTAQKDKEPTHIKDKEIHSGVTSFLSWIKKDVVTEIKEILKDETKSLEDLQKTLNKYNLELRERGAGIVISDKDRALYVKASDVDRGLSKGSLTKRFGAFKPSRIEEPAITKFGAKTTSLWDEYQAQTKTQRTMKKESLEGISDKGIESFKMLKDDYSRQRGLIKNNLNLSKSVKREAYRILNERRANDFKTLKEQLSGERSEIFKDNKFKTYTEFLSVKAAGGDSEAIRLLRKNEAKEQTGNILILDNKEIEAKSKILPGQKPNISKSGIVFYKMSDGNKIIDSGESLKLTTTFDKNETSLRELLDLAKIKFGSKPILVQGSKTFKKEIAEINSKIGLKITEPKNNDSTLDQIKKRIGEKHNAKRGRFTANHDEGRWDSYITSARAYYDGLTKQLENVIGHFRDIGRTGSDTIRERIADVFNSKDRSFGKTRGIDTDSIARATTDRGRDSVIQSAHVKNTQNDRVKKGGMER